MIDCARVIRIYFAARQRLFPALFTGNCRQPLDEAGAYCRRSRLLSGTRKDDLGCAQSLREIVRRQADTQLGQIEAEIEPHRPAQPWIAASVRRPAAFVEAPENDAVDALQARFQQAENPHARITDFSAPLSAPR